MYQGLNWVKDVKIIKIEVSFAVEWYIIINFAETVEKIGKTNII